jgi:polysaccharide biosynthesis protein PslJ
VVTAPSVIAAPNPGSTAERRPTVFWTTMLFLYAAIVMFIPIRRYALPIPLPFALEPYRAIIVVLLLGLIVAAVRRKHFRWQPVVWGWPIAIFLWTMLASMMFSSESLTETELIGTGLSNLLQLSLLTATIVLVRQLLTTERIVMALLQFIVFAGVVVGILAFVERVTRTNVFLLLGNFLPLSLIRDAEEAVRSGGARSYGSAQHPIALAVLFCMIIPLAIYLMRFSPWPRNPINRRVVYSIAVGFLLLGLLTTISRTATVTIGVMLLVTLILRPRLGAILLAAAIPLAVIAAMVLPKLVESMILSLLDTESLIASQMTSIGMAGQGRLADLAPALAEVAQSPFFGTGLGSRIVEGENANAYILDNQWLGTLMETGVLGVIGLVALFVWPAIRMLSFSFRSGAAPSRAFLTFAIAISAVGYATSMFLYDSFAFMQTLLVLAMLYAIAAWAMTAKSDERSLDFAPAVPVQAVGAR